MKNFLSVIFQALLMALTTSAMADDVEYAQRKDLIGYWQGIEISSQFQPKAFATSPWPLKCQWFAFFEDGRHATFMESANKDGQCAQLDHKTISEIFDRLPTPMFFTWEPSKEENKGLVFIGRNDIKTYAEIWAPHLFKVDAAIRGESYLKGDLFMRLLSKNNFTDTVWLRHLRRVSDQPTALRDAPRAALPELAR